MDNDLEAWLARHVPDAAERIPAARHVARSLLQCVHEGRPLSEVGGLETQIRGVLCLFGDVLRPVYMSSEPLSVSQLKALQLDEASIRELSRADGAVQVAVRLSGITRESLTHFLPYDRAHDRLHEYWIRRMSPLMLGILFTEEPDRRPTRISELREFVAMQVVPSPEYGHLEAWMDSERLLLYAGKHLGAPTPLHILDRMSKRRAAGVRPHPSLEAFTSSDQPRGLKRLVAGPLSQALATALMKSAVRSGAVAIAAALLDTGYTPDDETMARYLLQMAAHASPLWTTVASLRATKYHQCMLFAMAHGRGKLARLLEEERLPMEEFWTSLDPAAIVCRRVLANVSSLRGPGALFLSRDLEEQQVAEEALVDTDAKERRIVRYEDGKEMVGAPGPEERRIVRYEDGKALIVQDPKEQELFLANSVRVVAEHPDEVVPVATIPLPLGRRFLLYQYKGQLWVSGRNLIALSSLLLGPLIDTLDASSSDKGVLIQPVDRLLSVREGMRALFVRLNHQPSNEQLLAASDLLDALALATTLIEDYDLLQQMANCVHTVAHLMLQTEPQTRLSRAHLFTALAAPEQILGCVFHNTAYIRVSDVLYMSGFGRGSLESTKEFVRNMPVVLVNMEHMWVQNDDEPTGFLAIELLPRVYLFLKQEHGHRRAAKLVFGLERLEAEINRPDVREQVAKCLQEIRRGLRPPAGASPSGGGFAPVTPLRGLRPLAGASPP